MKRLFIILLCIGFLGCASSSKSKINQEQQVQLDELTASLNKKDEQIKKLQEQLVEKDAKVKELISKLESFGVFKVEKKEENPAVIKEEVKPGVGEVTPDK